MANLFKIPRTQFAKTDARWALVRKHGTSRKAMINFICGIGGYNAGRGEQFAIEFNVGVYHADMDVDRLWQICVSQDHGIAEMTAAKQVMAENLFRAAHNEHKNNLWNWGVEEAYESWSDSDMPYETFAGTHVVWQWEMHGRGGKHLCVVSCDGISLDCSVEDLEEKLTEYDTNCDGTRAGFMIDTDRVKKLFIICVQNSVELTSKKISDEVEYRAAWRLWVSFCEDQLPALVQAHETRDRLNGDADAIRKCLAENADKEQQDAFETILAIAGIQVETD